MPPAADTFGKRRPRPSRKLHRHEAGCSPRAATRTVRASRFINAIRKDVRRTVAAWTGVYQYTIDQVIEEMADRCDELQMRFTPGAEDRTRSDFIVALTVQTMNYLHSGRHRVAL